VKQSKRAADFLIDTYLAATEPIALVPGVDTASFVLLSPDNPEHALFVLNPAPAKSCGQ